MILSNLDNIERQKINNSEIINFLNSSLGEFFTFNSWIAGGFARLTFQYAKHVKNIQNCYIDALADSGLRGKKKDYSFANIVSNYIQSGGDCDFFSSRDSYNYLKELLKHPHPQSISLSEKSAYSHNFYLKREYSSGFIGLGLKVQVVNKFFFNNIEESFADFDFWNSCYAISKEAGGYYFYYHEEALKFDSKLLVGVKNSKSPFTNQ